MNAYTATPKQLDDALKAGKTAKAQTENLNLTAGYAEIVEGYVFAIQHRNAAPSEKNVVGASTLGALYEAMERYAPLSEWQIEGS